MDSGHSLAKEPTHLPVSWMKGVVMKEKRELNMSPRFLPYATGYIGKMGKTGEYTNQFFT